MAGSRFTTGFHFGPSVRRMKTPQAILGAVVAALALAAFVTFYDYPKPDTQTAPHADEAAEKTDLLSLASSIAHDFTVLPKSVHSTSSPSIAEEFADLPKSVHTVPVRSDAPPTKQAIAVAPPPAPPAPRNADLVASTTLPSHPELDVCARNGGHRVNFMRGHHGMWRCVYPRRRS
jgi:hypothetical protein